MSKSTPAFLAGQLEVEGIPWVVAFEKLFANVGEEDILDVTGGDMSV